MTSTEAYIKYISDIGAVQEIENFLESAASIVNIITKPPSYLGE